jgi:ferric-dicitrate binding protein FerR (iron transport regulator)
MKNADPRNSKAYAEGRQAKYALKPASANPHPFDSEAYAAWDRGWLSVVSLDGPILGVDCVAEPARGSAP